MSSEEQLLADNEIVLRGFEDVLRVIQTRIAETSHKVARLNQKRQKTIESHVDRLLPDLEQSTLKTLARMPEFVTDDVRSLFLDAAQIPVSTWSRITGSAPKQRVNTLWTKFSSLRIKLTAFVDNDNEHSIFADVHDLKQEISEVDAQIRNLLLKEKQVREEYERVGKAKIAITSNKRQGISPEGAQYMRTAADTLRDFHRTGKYRPRQGASTHPDDDGTDLLLWWTLDIPTSPQTLILDEVFHDHGLRGDPVQQTFGGGGGFSGGGGGDEFGDTPSTPTAPTDSVTSDDLGSAAGAIIATDDSLGLYS